MPEIHLTQQVNSETLHVPELRPFIGKQVEITIREVPSKGASSHGWDALLEVAGQDLIDPDVYQDYREFDKQHWRANSP